MRHIKLAGRNKAVFVDRDGTINVDEGYTHKIEDFRFMPNAEKGLKEIAKSGKYKLIIITSQAGIGRGYFKEEDMHRFNEHMQRELKKHSVKIDGIYFCPHHPEDKCSCRKPEIGLIKKAEKDFDLDLKESWFIGDRDRDIITGKKAGCRTILVLTGRGTEKDVKELKPDFIAKDLSEAAGFVLRHEKI